MAVSIYVSNPIILAKAMEVALEVTHSLIKGTEYDDLNILKDKIFNLPDNSTFIIDKKTCQSLVNCISAFKNSTTCNWIRSDFTKKIFEIEDYCLKYLS
ncbi:hypothetical protein V7128_17750 [Neobacillus vireti]|uniref:hypothetical protein n=1 Tax=Neobacillus vireti TaxID=220686 RepID=UPI002FFD7793